MTAASASPEKTRNLLSWGTLGQIVYVSSQFILLMALARFSDVETVGYFGLSSAIIIPIYWLLRLELRVNLASDAAQRYWFTEFLTLLALTMTLAYLTLVGISLTLMDGAARSVLLLFGLAKLSETFSELCYGQFQKERQMKRVAKSQILRGLVSAALFFAILATTRRTDAAFLGLLGVWAAVLLVYDLPSAIRISKRLGEWQSPRLTRIWELFLKSLPLGMNGLLSALQGNMPRYAVERMIGISSLGQLTVVMYAMQAMTTVAMAISHSLTATFARQARNNNRAGFFRTLKKLLAMIWSLSILATLIAALLGDLILETVFGSEFSGLGLVLTICTFGAGLRASVLILQGALLAARSFSQNLQIRIAMLCLMAALCVLGGLFAGLTGIVTGMSTSFLIHAAILWIVLLKLPFHTPEC